MKYKVRPITEKMIKAQMKDNRLYYHSLSKEQERELAKLMLKDAKRKGCLMYGPNCKKCPFENGCPCPMDDWHSKHPDWLNDELSHRIEVLKAGGEEAYAEKQERDKRHEEMQESFFALMRSCHGDITDAALKTSKFDAIQKIFAAYAKSKAKFSKTCLFDHMNDIVQAKSSKRIASIVNEILGS